MPASSPMYSRESDSLLESVWMRRLARRPALRHRPSSHMVDPLLGVHGDGLRLGKRGRKMQVSELGLHRRLKSI